MITKAKLTIIIIFLSLLLFLSRHLAHRTHTFIYLQCLPVRSPFRHMYTIFMLILYAAKENKTNLHFIHNTIVALTDEQMEKEQKKDAEKKRQRLCDRQTKVLNEASGKWQYIIYGFCLTVEQVYLERVSRYVHCIIAI